MIYDVIVQHKIIDDAVANAEIVKGNKRNKSTLLICSGFDIETTSINDDKTAYMYHWQLSINDNALGGRTWESFSALLKYIKNCINKRFHKSTPQMIMWVANLSFEFQFIKDRFSWDKIFATEQRQVLVATADCFSFRECLRITVPWDFSRLQSFE